MGKSLSGHALAYIAASRHVTVAGRWTLGAMLLVGLLVIGFTVYKVRRNWTLGNTKMAGAWPLLGMLLLALCVLITEAFGYVIGGSLSSTAVPSPVISVGTPVIHSSASSGGIDPLLLWTAVGAIGAVLGAIVASVALFVRR